MYKALFVKHELRIVRKRDQRQTNGTVNERLNERIETAISADVGE